MNATLEVEVALSFAAMKYIMHTDSFHMKALLEVELLITRMCRWQKLKARDLQNNCL